MNLTGGRGTSIFVFISRNVIEDMEKKEYERPLLTSFELRIEGSLCVSPGSGENYGGSDDNDP